MIGTFELVHHVVGVEHRVLGGALDAFGAEAHDVGAGLEDDAEAPVEGSDAAYGLAAVDHEAVGAVGAALHAGRGQEGQELFAHAHRTGAGTAAAVRRGEGVVEVEVHDVEAHVAHAHLAHDGVHVGAVVVEQCVHGVDDLHNLLQAGLHEAQSVGAGHHEAGEVVAVLRNGGLEGLGIDHAVLGLDGHGGEAGHGGGGGVGAVRGVGNEHDATAAPLGLVVGRDEGDAGELAVGAGHGLESEALHARDLAQEALGVAEHLQGALAGLLAGLELGQHGMQAGEAGQLGDGLRALGVVLHGARAQGVEVGVHAVVELGQSREVPDDVDLGQPELEHGTPRPVAHDKERRRRRGRSRLRLLG